MTFFLKKFEYFVFDYVMFTYFNNHPFNFHANFLYEVILMPAGAPRGLTFYFLILAVIVFSFASILNRNLVDTILGLYQRELTKSVFPKKKITVDSRYLYFKFSPNFYTIILHRWNIFLHVFGLFLSYL